jgi:hypothetical protein
VRATFETSVSGSTLDVPEAALLKARLSDWNGIPQQD